MAAAVAKLLWAICAAIVLYVAAFHGRRWGRKRQKREAAGSAVAQPPRRPVSLRPEYRSRGPRRAS
jgi:hypothetical protein